MFRNRTFKVLSILVLLVVLTTSQAAADVIPPTVTAIDPSSAFNDLDAPVTITGTGFTTDAGTPPTVSLGDTALTNVVWVDSNTLTATVPWGMNPGVYSLTVVNPDGGTGSMAGAFTVNPGIGQWNSGNLFGGSASQILLKPGDPNTVYVMASGVGLFRSRDAGENWKFISNDWGNVDFVVDPHRPSRLYFERYNGLYRSDDEGDTWTMVFDKWPDGRLYGAGQVHVSPHNAQLLFFSSTGGHGSGARGLIMSTDSGANWNIISDMEGIPVRTLAFHPSDSQKMVLGTSDGRVFQSTDGGAHWNPGNKPPIDDIGIITYNPFVDGEVWVAGYFLLGGLVKSGDGAFTNWINIIPYNSMSVGSIDFTSATSVYLANEWEGGYHSNDDGLSWASFGPSPTGGFDIAFTQDNLNVMYIGDDRYGIQKTTDGGQTWEVKNQGFTAMVSNSMAGRGYFAAAMATPVGSSSR